MTDAPITNWAEFEAAVAAHDLTYSYSDDHRVYRRGEAQRRRIMAAATDKALAFKPSEVERVWNAMVDSRMKEPYREQFHWAWPQAPAPALADGCNSAAKPCDHQKKDPTTICAVCKEAKARLKNELRRR